MCIINLFILFGVGTASLQCSHTLPPTLFFEKRSTWSHSNPLNKTGGTRLLNLSTNSSSISLPFSTSVPPNHSITVCPVLPSSFFSPPYRDKNKPSAPVGPVGIQSVRCIMSAAHQPESRLMLLISDQSHHSDFGRPSTQSTPSFHQLIFSDNCIF